MRVPRPSSEEEAVARPEVVACHMVDLPLAREVKSTIAIQTLKAGAVLPLGPLNP